MFVFPFSFPPSSLQILGVFIQLNKPELVSFFCVCFKYLIPVLDPCYGSIELIFCSCFGKLQDCRRTFVYNFSLNKNGLHVWPSPYLRTLQFISFRRFRFLTWYLLQRSKFQSSDLQGSIDGNRTCSRLYFKFNDTRYCGRMTIEAVQYDKWRFYASNLIDQQYLLGYYENISEGEVKVELWVGRCDNGISFGDSLVGWESVSRIIVEKVSKSQGPVSRKSR